MVVEDQYSMLSVHRKARLSYLRTRILALKSSSRQHGNLKLKLSALLGFYLLLGGASLAQAQENAAGPYLSAKWRLTDNDGKPADELKAGHSYKLHITLTVSQRDGVKINPLVKSQKVRLQGVSRRNVIHLKGGTVDAKTGKAVIDITVFDNATKLPATASLLASLVLCDEAERWCALVHESANIQLSGGMTDLTAGKLPLNAGDKERVILKPGDKAPDFTVTTDANNPLKLSDYRGKKHIILVFSRAHW